VPEGKQNSDQFDNFVAALELYTSHQANYITKPAGWGINFSNSNFDASKVQTAIDFEDKGIVKAFLANFLELGMSGSGSYALSFDQSDFFLGALEHIAKIICEEFNSVLIPQLIKLNRGNRDAYPKLKVSGITDKAGKELADVVKILADGKIIVPDDQLEEHMRERYQLPKMSDIGKREVQPAPSFGFTETISFAEKADPRKQMKASKEVLKALMQSNLKAIGEGMVEKILKNYNSLPPARKLDAAKDVVPGGTNNYRDALTEALVDIAFEAEKKARAEVPKLRDVKYSDGRQFQFATKFKTPAQRLEALPKAVQKRIKNQSELLVQTQLADLEKSVKFQFLSSVDSTDSAELIRKDLGEAVDDFYQGASIEVGASNTASAIVNSARNAFFFTDEVLTEVESFTFVNGDPQSPICQDLAGRVFAKDDPEADRFYPPLHHNCKSYLVPNLKGGKNKPVDKTGLKPSDPKLEKFISLSEEHDGGCCG
jgi:hypothetical protein